MRRTHRRTTVSALASLLLLGLAACSGSIDPFDPNSDLPADLAGDIGAAQTEEAEEAVGALTLEGTSAEMAPAVGGTTSFAVALAPFQLRPPYGYCATVDNTTDSDGDGTPNQATFTYALPACHFTNLRGGTLDVTGVIVLSDPTPTAADWTYHMTLDDFRQQYTNPDQTRSYSALRNGTRAFSANAASASLTSNVTVVRSATGHPDVTISHNTLLTFTPDEGTTLQRHQALPSGTITKSGTVTWSRDSRSRTFTVVTVVPLRWDATCTTARKISAGEIHWELANGSYIKAVWTACGVDPTREFVRAS